ncbi:carboxymuconolactone decarboxylase family protein [Pseudomonas chlororaphis]|uniref:carboxymuconolactone decarboxylase family protein n=1 Tax=Pseudomonas chlororaphis TaxID=587753 RepID=UPI0006A5E12A|nr:carboxymuconolactone decarboxylase family protein [Pseudomonas chlororaphis]AZD02583.1 Macrophage infectivity potentiator-related protein [Pseudomonas chlororaphis subsp. chlororaphis]MBM0280628.1 carboxymuconolactone decarboxylase family protein [Pseudomonas chlororaphis]MDO1504732.1 carboxymuconolactone decarboxylase family protein [Pseudomonas chlororaphis]ORM44514.1 alkylhydroperoxidase [Pseudomonas chlororaphis subsp. chlororaphis]TWR95861.1 carboxymuconolactone decarboxylase family pr
MSRITLHSLQSAPEAARPFLQNAQNNSGFIPNLLGILANAPAALETYVTVSALNGKAELSLAEREVVQLVAATTHGCDFCVAGHTAVAQNKAKLSDEVISALRERSPLPEEKLQALAAFAAEVIATRGNVSEPTFAAFKAAGYSEGNALEVILGVSLATLCNFANVFARTPLNPELAKYRWQAPQQ